MATISGTFTGTGTTAGVASGKVYIDMTFAGTATVDVQWLLDGNNWRSISSYTSSSQVIVESGGIPVRLNCTAYTNNVSWAIRDK
jgi:nicotinamide mononucleotide (NMN) deamidase PncC